MTKKQTARMVVFLALAVLLIVFLCRLFKYENTHMSERFHTYLAQENGAIDAVYIGASSVDRYWNAAKAYEEYGMTVYPLSTSAMPTFSRINMIKEALKTQSPELIILDVRSFVTRKEVTYSSAKSGIHYISDMMSFFSPNRISTIQRGLEYLHEMDPEENPKFDISFYLPVVQFHEKWDDASFSFDELENTTSPYLGFYIHNKRSLKQVSVTFDPETEERLPLEEVNEKYLIELLDYVKEQDLNVLFVLSPYATKQSTYAQINTMADILDEYGYPHLFYTTDELLSTYDTEQDFYNTGHVNFYGAEKYTAQLAEYLDSHYQFPDHREDPKCESWNGVYARIQKRIERIRNNLNK